MASKKYTTEATTAKFRRVVIIALTTCACEHTIEVPAPTESNVVQGTQNVYAESNLNAFFPTNTITLCGYKTPFFDQGDDSVFDRKMDIMREVLRQWEYASGIQFQYTTRCPARTTNDGKDYYPGDIRIAYRGKGAASSTTSIGDRWDCVQSGLTFGDSDWAHLPSMRTWDHVCPFNVLISDDPEAEPWKSIHEVGHALGMPDEKTRWADINCTERQPGPGEVFLTPADQASVMNYGIRDANDQEKEPGLAYCQIKAPMTGYDRVGLEILYPKYPSTQQKIYAPGLMPFDGYFVSLPGPILPDWRERGALPGIFNSKNDFCWGIPGVTACLRDNNGITIGVDGLSTASLPQDVVSTPYFAFRDPWNRYRSGLTRIMPSAAKATSVIMVAAAAISS